MQNYIVNMIEENECKIDVNKPNHFLHIFSKINHFIDKYHYSN